MKRQPPAVDDPTIDDSLAVLLQAIAGRDAADGPLDSATLCRRLGWTAAMTAQSLGVARSRLLIWGIRTGGNPAPCFDDIELTVQGRRFLSAGNGVTSV